MAGGPTVDVWWFPLDPDLGDESLLDAAERERLAAMGSRSKRREYRVSRSVLRRVLARYAAVDPRSLRFAYGEHGKPAIAGEGPSFNLTHSAAYGAVAVARGGQLGLDVEHVARARPFERLARRFFAPAEAAWLERQGLIGDAAAFYRLWTLKEAYVKALGTGLSFSSRCFALNLEDTPPEIAASEAAAGVSFGLRELDAPAGYAAALCWDRPLGAVRRRHLDALPA